MKKYINIIIIVILLFFTSQVLWISKDVIESTKFSFDIWRNNVFPSLFPFFVLASLLIHYGFIDFLSELMKNVMSIFKLSPSSSFVLVMSMISGFPSSAKYTKELYQKELITKQEAEKILTFSHFSNPLFILGTIGLFLNHKIALLIMVIHYGTNIIIGLIFRDFYPSTYHKDKVSLTKALRKLNRQKSKESFGKVLSYAIMDSINTLLLILGTMSIFLILTTILDYHLDVSPYFQAIINGFFEMTQGIKYASELNLSLKIQSILMTMFISFGGISVHIQTISILSDTDVRYIPYLIARMLHAGIAGFLIYILFDVFI